MRVAVIGAGAAGLASARHVLAAGHQCDILETSPQLGGTWYYTDEVGKDKYGYPVYSAMYQGLRTNLPKEVMGFPDFPIPEQHKSYLTQAEILAFLNLYADQFNLRSLIKFNHHVKELSPVGNKWKISAINKPENKEIVEVYDAVMICNGHYSEPSVPIIIGQEKFKGKQCHSHQYRSPQPFKDLRVLVIGAGPSGMDLALHIAGVAKYVVLSHHIKEPINSEYPSNVELKPDVRCINNHEEVEFIDETTRCFDSIVYCTGYKYSFPFLNPACGVTVEDTYIQPLYKHMIYIDNPTLCFIGIPVNVCAFQMFDLQARFFVSSLDGAMKLPSIDEMRKNTEEDMKMRLDKGYTKRQAHHMGPYQQAYYSDLAKLANTTPIPPVIVKLRDESVKRLFDDLTKFREDRYKIVDSENFIKVH